MPANILYRDSTTPTVPVTTSAKGLPLTNLEIDGNFKSVANAISTAETTVSNLTTTVNNKAEVSDVLAFSIALG